MLHSDDHDGNADDDDDDDDEEQQINIPKRKLNIRM